MVLARADPRRRAWAVPCFALPRRGLHERARGGAAREGASGEGLRCSPTRVVGARADGAGTATTQTFSTTGRFGFANDRSIAERKSRPATRRDRVRQEPGLNDRHARAKHLGLLSQLARLRAAPGGHRGESPRARAPVAAPRSTPAPRLPATASSRKLRLPAAPLPELPHSEWWPPRSSTTGSPPTSTS